MNLAAAESLALSFFLLGYPGARIKVTNEFICYSLLLIEYLYNCTFFFAFLWKTRVYILVDTQ